MMAAYDPEAVERSRCERMVKSLKELYTTVTKFHGDAVSIRCMELRIDFLKRLLAARDFQRTSCLPMPLRLLYADTGARVPMKESKLLIAFFLGQAKAEQRVLKDSQQRRSADSKGAL